MALNPAAQSPPTTTAPTTQAGVPVTVVGDREMRVHVSTDRDLVGSWLLPIAAIVIAAVGWRTTRALGRSANNIATSAAKAGSLGVLSAYSERFESRRMVDARRHVAAALLAGKRPDHGVRFVVPNYFEELALAARVDAIPVEMVWSFFGDFIVSYWYGLEPEFAQARSDPGTFDELAWLVERCSEFNAKKGIKDTRQWATDCRDDVFEAESLLAHEDE